MLGLMQPKKLLISSLITHAARHHGTTEVVSKTVEGAIHRYTYADAERALPPARPRAARARRQGPGPGGDPGMEQPSPSRGLLRRLRDGGDLPHREPAAARRTTSPTSSTTRRTAWCSPTSSFAPLLARSRPTIAGTVRAVVMMTEPALMPDIASARRDAAALLRGPDRGGGRGLRLAGVRREHRERLCYTSGTTGRPKGVLYSHRSTLLHAFSVNMATALGFRSIDRVLPVVPMFHVNAWGIPHAAPMAGTALVHAGAASRRQEPRRADEPGARDHVAPACRPSGWACSSICAPAASGCTTWSAS